jgi:TolA-binding protein
MEQYSNQQKEIFQVFYEACQEKGIDPLKSEADRQRALLLAKENTELVKIFGDRLDGAHVDAYRMGREHKDAKIAAKEQADKEAKIAEQRKNDEAAAELERSISLLRGRDKRRFFYQKWEAEADDELKNAQQAYHAIFEMADLEIKMGQQKESSWGTLGGIAAGVTGSTAVGAAVAADTMRKNSGVRKNNEAIKQAVFQSITPRVDSVQRSISIAKEKKEAIQKQGEAIQIQLTEDRPVAELMEALTVDIPQIAFTKGNSMLIRAKVTANKTFTIAGSVPAVIDGSFMAEVYEGDRKIGEAYLNLPLAGAKGTATLRGHCLEGKPGGVYTVVIIPVALWLIEAYKASPVEVSKWRPIKEGGTEKFTYEIPDLKDMIPAYTAKFSWQEISLHNVTWQQRLEEIRLEAERKAEEGRRAEEVRKAEAAARAKRNKKIAMVAAPIAVVAVIAGVVIFNNAKSNAKSNAAYSEAVALIQSGEYDEAVAAFEALGDYKDSVEQVQNAKYMRANALLNDKHYADAATAFAELGDYKDSVEQATAAELMAKNDQLYNEALEIFLAEEGVLTSELNTVLSLLEQVSPDWKDTATLVETIPQFMEMLKQVDGVYKLTKQEERPSYHKNSEYIFEVAGDSWKFEYTSETTTEGEVVKSEPVTDSGSIFWKFKLEDGKVSFSDEVGDYTNITQKEYYELPDLSLENGIPSFETNGWVKQ